MGSQADAWAEGLRHVWLPYAQMKTEPEPLPVAAAYGSRLLLEDERELIDGVGSWWTQCHGYNHPHIRAAVARQLQVLPHVMFGGLAHAPALDLARRLCALLGEGFERVFFSESGSVAVEVAMKMALQAWINRGERGRTRFVAFRGGYHGDTLGTMSVCDPEEGMHALFEGVLARQLICELPTDEAKAAALEQTLQAHAGQIAGVIVEPLVQGAGGMLFHAPQTLVRLREAADRHGLYLIFDEIFTGFGRTGSMFAFQQAGVRPDIITLGKALSGGTLPLAATVASPEVASPFWSDDPGKALMHGPTFMANPLACAAANASLDLFEREPRLAQVEAISEGLRDGLEPCRALTGVRDVRVLGDIGVVELERAPSHADLRQKFVERGVWIRPFGRVVYLTPAFTIPEHELGELTRAVVEVTAEIAR